MKKNPAIIFATLFCIASTTLHSMEKKEESENTVQKQIAIKQKKLGKLKVTKDGCSPHVADSFVIGTVSGCVGCALGCNPLVASILGLSNGLALKVVEGLFKLEKNYAISTLQKEITVLEKKVKLE